MDADMQGADLRDANLEGATLLETNLEAANMKGANLKDVHMKGYLRRESGELIITDLSREEVERKSAPLVTFELVDPRFSVSTILPDGTNWTPDTDMARFTDPDHPKFWQGYDVAGRDLRERNFSSANLQGAKLNKANLQGANLNKANLQEANLWEANLQGARHLTCEQLGQAASLEGAALPDGTQLPDDDTWRAAFDEWCQTVETDDGDIVPAALDDDADAGE